MVHVGSKKLNTKIEAINQAGCSTSTATPPSNTIPAHIAGLDIPATSNTAALRSMIIVRKALGISGLSYTFLEGPQYPPVAFQYGRGIF